MVAGINFSDPNTMNMLTYYLAGLGREIGGNQGAAEALGAPTQQMIQTQNYMNLLKQMGTDGVPAAPVTPATPATTPGIALTDKTPAVGTAGKSKITIEGSALDDVTKALSGLSNAQEGSGLEGGSGINWTPDNIPRRFQPNFQVLR